MLNEDFGFHLVKLWTLTSIVLVWYGLLLDVMCMLGVSCSPVLQMACLSLCIEKKSWTSVLVVCAATCFHPCVFFFHIELHT